MPVDEVDAVVDPLVAAYQRSWDRVNTQIGKLADDPLQARKVARLREVRAAVDREMTYLDKEVASRAHQAMFWTNELGFATGAVSAGAQTVRWDLIDRGAAEKAAGRMYQDLLSATTHVTQTTRGLTNAIANDELLGKLIEGRTAVQAGHRMAQLLEENGVHAVTYANGARHGLDEYSAMAMRTASADVYNGSLVEGAVAEGCKWFEIFDGPDCGLEGHDVGDIADGLIVDSQTADTFRISHPNCRRTFGARPDITSAEQAADASRSTTLAQREDQIRADQVRGLPMSQRGVEAAQPQVRGRPEPPDPHGHRAARAAAQGAVDRGEARTFREFENAAEGNAWGREKYSGWSGDQITDGERRSLKDYTGGGYHINKRLRHDTELMDSQVQLRGRLDRALAKQPLPENVTLYRGVDRNWDEFVKNFDNGTIGPGYTLTDKGFMSTSVDRKVAQEFSGSGGVGFEIRAPEGTKGAWMGDVSMFGTAEGEVLLARDTALRVVDVQYDEATTAIGTVRTNRKIIAEVVSQGAD